MKRYLFLGYILLALLISFITLQPYFMHGAINFYETGIYLPQINEIFHGRVLYRDMFVLRGPLEILMPAFFMGLFGRHIGILYGYFYFGTVLTLLFYAVFALRIFNTRGFTYLFTLVLTARTFPRVTYAIWGGIRFGMGILALILAINFLRKRKSIWLFLAGMMSGLLFWASFEISIFSFISILAMLCFLGYLEKDIKIALRGIFIYIMGNLMVSSPFIIYFFVNSIFIHYAEIIKVVLTNMTNIFDPSLCFETPGTFKEFLLAFSPLNHNFKYTLPFFFYVSIGIYLFKRILKKKFTGMDISIITVFIYGVFLYKSAFRDIEGPQYRMALQPVLLLMFFYLERIYIYVKKINPVPGLKKALIVFLILAIPIFSIAFSLYKYNKRFFIFREIKSLAANKKHIDIPYTHPEPLSIKSERAKGIIVPGYQAQEIDSVVAYISSNTNEREVVFTFPDLGTYNFLTDRPPLGRFYTAEFSFMDPEWFRELMLDLNSKKPRFVICARDFSRLEQFRATLGGYLDEVRQYLDENYEIVRYYPTVNILKIKVID